VPPNATTVAHRTDPPPVTPQTDPTDPTVRVSFAQAGPLVTARLAVSDLVGTGLARERATRRRRLGP